MLATGTNVHVLEKKFVVIDDITFRGATLWTDLTLPGDSRIDGSIYQEKMNDYQMIKKDPSYSKLRSIDTYVIHQASLKRLQASLEVTTTKNKIVVTLRSIPEQFKANALLMIQTWSQ